VIYTYAQLHKICYSYCSDTVIAIKKYNLDFGYVCLCVCPVELYFVYMMFKCAYDPIHQLHMYFASLLKKKSCYMCAVKIPNIAEHSTKADNQMNHEYV